MSEIKTGVRVGATSTHAEFMVVRIPDGDVDLTCSGAPLVALDDVSDPADDDSAPAILLGKRYADAGDSVELLCTKAGHGLLSFAGNALDVRAPKALPTSD